jgi:hypothetical protein
MIAVVLRICEPGAFDAPKCRPSLYMEKVRRVSDEGRQVLESWRGGRIARALRIAAMIVCPPLLVLANVAVCSNVWYCVLLAYAPIAGGWIGLISRPVLDAVRDRAQPRYEFSGKGFIVGSVTAFLMVLAFAPQRVDRSALFALFLAGAQFYYAIGKGGCMFLGCCQAVASRAIRVPLPAIEAAWALTLCVAAFVTAFEPHNVRMQAIPTIVALLLALRVYSRWARGARLAAALMQLDSLLLECVVVLASIAIRQHA